MTNNFKLKTFNYISKDIVEMMKKRIDANDYKRSFKDFGIFSQLVASEFLCPIQTARASDWRPPFSEEWSCLVFLPTLHKDCKWTCFQKWGGATGTGHDTFRRLSSPPLANNPSLLPVSPSLPPSFPPSLAPSAALTFRRRVNYRPSGFYLSAVWHVPPSVSVRALISAF